MAEGNLVTAFLVVVLVVVFGWGAVNEYRPVCETYTPPTVTPETFDTFTP